MFSIRPQLIFWLCAAVALFGQAMVLRALLAGRTPASDVSSPSRAREVLWIVLPAVAVCAVLFATWRAILVPERAPGQLNNTAKPVVTAALANVCVDRSRAADVACYTASSVWTL